MHGGRGKDAESRKAALDKIFEQGEAEEEEEEAAGDEEGMNTIAALLQRVYILIVISRARR